MELEFRKHFKDATSLLLMMDHDSGYVEGAESYTSSSNDSGFLKEPSQKPYMEADNLFLSEDALLEKPDISFNFGDNLPYEIDTKDYEETRKLFFSPEVINSSVQSENSMMTYSGLENETSSEASAEIPLEPRIILDNKMLSDILTTTTSESDLSLEQTFDPVIIEQSGSNCSTLVPFKGFPEDSKESAITSTSNCVLSSEKKLQETNKDIQRTPLKVSPHSATEWSVSSIQKSETPSKSNPLSAVTNTFSVSKEKKRLMLVFSKSDKENGYSVKRKYPSITPDKKIQNPVDPDISPDIFDDEIIDNKTNYFQIQSQDNVLTHTDEKYVDKLDQRLLKRTQKGMSGVLPPPSVTVIPMSVDDIWSKLEKNKSYCFWNDKSEGVNEEKLNISLNSSNESNQFSKSLLLSVGLAEAQTAEWSEVLNMRCHGLHYNCGKVSEEIIDLCDKYQKRFVGAETQSTCTVFETQTMTSPSKRKMTKPRWGGKSPGRRLSHLARRRITFSSANLQGGSSLLAGSRARQILVDAKKIDLSNRRKSPTKSTRKTPKKTPSKSPKVKTRTPSSSAKKKLAMRFRKLTGEFEKSLPGTSVHRALFKSPTKSENRNTKRALFQSPNHDTTSSLFASKSQDSFGFDERNQLRRALFTSTRKSSPPKTKKSPFKQFGFEKKRKRSESDDLHPCKLPRSVSMDVQPSTSNKTLFRAQSELNISLNRSQTQNELSEQHKKKLLWAVSGALQSQNITNAHPQWKVFASVLARVTRRFFASQMAASGAKPEGGTTERMHRIARYHVISVIKGKSADEIINEYVKSRVRVQRPQGYVAPDDFNNGRVKAPSGSKENVFQDRVNTIESWEKRKLEQVSKQATSDNKIDRIRKVINFGDDR